MRTEKRKDKIKSVLFKRQLDLHLVLENIHDPHNVSAILRTCDAVGIDSVSLLYHVEKYPKIGIKSSASAGKWISRKKFDNVSECFLSLRDKGYKVLASSLNEKSVSLYNLDLTEKVAIIMGNEHRGISEQVEKEADSLFYIPMQGMVQSLNVSVAAAVILYEAMRQREVKGKYLHSQFSDTEFDLRLQEFLKK